MPVTPAIIDDPAEVTAEWLGAILAERGHAVRVASIEREAVGTGQMAHNERFFLRYDGDAAGAPETVVIKFPSPSEESRASGARGGYACEVRFYTELLPQLSVVVPDCFHGAVSEDGATFSLVLEDLAPAQQGDQIAGARDDQIEAAVRNLAGLHGPRWGDAALERADWLAMGFGPETAQVVAAVAPLFVERFDGRLSDDAVRVLRGFGEGAGRWLESLPAPRTLVHGDYRLDNLMFLDTDEGVRVSAVDWQTLAFASAGQDLAYLLGNSCPPAQRRAHEERMLGAYREALAKSGVPLGAEEVFERYRHGSFQGPFITMLGCMAVGQTDRGDEMFIAMAERSAAQILDLDALALLR